MQVYGSGTDQHVNGSAPPIDDDERSRIGEDDDEDWAGEEGQYDYSNLFTAPNYADFIRTKPNSKAKSYEVRWASMMKAGMVLSLNNEQWPDAATFMKHGPGFAKAAGNLAAVDGRFAGLTEMLTAPESPHLMFAMIAIPLFAQLFRNHQPEIQEAGQTWRERRARKKAEKKAGYVKPSAPPITVRLFRREIKLPVRFRIRMPRLKNVFGAFVASTQHPNHIAQEVFSDPQVIKALHQMGLFPRGGQSRASEDEAA